MRHPTYPFWSFICLVLVLLPFRWHWRVQNIATMSLIVWLALANLIIFVNSLIWAENYDDLAPVWCDISGHILIGVLQAVPACSLAQMRRLESVASTRRTTFSIKERRRRMLLEISICIFFPILTMPLNYVVNGHRYDIYEDVGCVVGYYLSWPGYALHIFLPAAICLGALIYAGLSVRWFLRRRLQFRAILATSEASLSVGRYLRLIALAVSDSVIILVGAAMSLSSTIISAKNAGEPFALPYTSWDDIHHNYSQVWQFPTIVSNPATELKKTMALYLIFLYSITFFTFFGLGEEAIAEYLRIATWCRTRLESLGLLKGKPLIPDIDFTLGSKVVRTTVSPESDMHHTDQSSSPMVHIFDRKGGDGGGDGIDVQEQEQGQGQGQGRGQGRGYGIPVSVERSVV